MADGPNDIQSSDGDALEPRRGGTRKGRKASEARGRRARRVVAPKVADALGAEDGCDVAAGPNEAAAPAFEDTPRARARFVSQRLMLGKTLQEIMAEAPQIDPLEYFETIETDPEARAYDDRARKYAAHWLTHESRTLVKELMAQRKPTANEVRRAVVAADINKFVAQSWHKDIYSNKPAAAAPMQLQINTTLDLGQNTPQALTAENVYDLPRQLPPPSAPMQDTRPTLYGQPVTDAEFSEVERGRAQEREPSREQRQLFASRQRYSEIGWYTVSGKRLHGYWDKGPPSKFVGVPTTETDNPFMPLGGAELATGRGALLTQEQDLKQAQGAFIREGMASLENADTGEPRQNGSFGGFDPR